MAIVTGASSGIGRATGEALAAAGYGVVLAARTKAKLDEVAAGIAAAHPGRPVVARPTNLGRFDEVRGLVEETVARFGRLDALVNNAGIATILPIERTTPDVFADMHGVNLLGPAAAMHYAWPTFLRQRSGRVVNVSSMAAIDPFPGFFAYASSKAGLNMVTLTADREGREAGIRAFAVCPGAVETPMLRSAFDETAIPRELALSPEAVAAVVVECVLGQRDANAGEPIALLAPAVVADLRRRGLPTHGA